MGIDKAELIDLSTKLADIKPQNMYINPFNIAIIFNFLIAGIILYYNFLAARNLEEGGNAIRRKNLDDAGFKIMKAGKIWSEMMRIYFVLLLISTALAIISLNLGW